MNDSTERVAEIAPAPLLSLILCSRNDEYMGNSRWRLETALNYVSERVRAIGHESDVEILVADWGSDVPLSDSVRLSSSARGLVRFLHVPPPLARALQADSPFPEVLALNAVARQARGRYLGRIDQDTLVGTRFLRWFFGSVTTDTQLEPAVFFSCRRSIPYRFTTRCLSPGAVDTMVAAFGRLFRVERAPAWAPFFASAVGIFLVPTALWHESGGYDEDMIYMGAMETNMIGRLMRKYPIVDLGRLVGHDFYHLEHHHPWAVRSCWAGRRPNDDRAKMGSALDHMNPNGPGWGLVDHAIPLAPPAGAGGRSPISDGDTDRRAAVPLLLWVGALAAAELLLVRASTLPSRLRSAVRVWVHRVAVARSTIRGRPISEWAGLLRKRWEQPERDQVFP